MKRFVSNNGWTIGLACLLGLLLIATKLIQPDFGVSGLDSLGRAALPFALATLGMAVVVIAGGIDLSLASMMAVSSVTAATLMQGASDGQSAMVLVFVLALGAAMGAVNGALVVVTRVPDIVVTLSMLFVWQGVALSVGGLTLPFVPEALTVWLPKSVVFLFVCLAVIWLPIRRSKLGLMFYAIGSDALAAFRSGVPVGRTKIASYAVTGLFAALGGIAVTMSTGIGEPIPGPYLLAAVAAVVLGGVVLGGGRGGLLGPVLAVFVLRLVRMDLTLMSVDPNVTTIVEGSIMVVVVMFGGVVAMRGRRT
jgi:ribose transport system permease protein